MKYSLALLSVLIITIAGFFASPALAVQVSVEPLEGTFRADDFGGVNYSLPIKSPPGINGVEPALAIQYHSSQAKGLLGIGFDISGLSKVSRCPATQSIEGLFDRVDFDDNDAICVDGKKVIPADGTAMPLRYYPVVENGDKIVRHGSLTGSSWFQVWKKSGQIYEYGTAKDAKLIHPEGEVSWLLTKIKDRNGNYIEYTYSRDGEHGLPRIASIEYTKNDAVKLANLAKLNFVYKAKPAVKTYIHGQEYTDDKILASLNVYSGATFAWQYSFTYTNDLGPNPYLKEIGLCSPDSLCTNPLTFNWAGQAKGRFAKVELVSDFFGKGWSSKSTYRLLLDLNSDGFNDILGMNRDGVFVAYGSSAGFGEPTKVLDDFKYSDTGWVYSRHPMRFSDMDRDGYVDLIGFHDDEIFYAKGRAGGFAKAIAIGKEFTINDGWLRSKSTREILDVDGDGLPDIVGLNGKGVWVALGTGTGFGKKSQWSTDFSDDQGWKIKSRDIIRFLDVDGDGKADILGKKGADLYISLNAGDKFAPYQVAAKGMFPDPFSGRKLFYSDMNADGNLDIVFTDLKGVKVALGTGVSFGPATLWGKSFGADDGWSSKTHYRDLIDMNKDGLPDFIGFSKNGLEVALSTGTGFQPAEAWLDGFKPDGPWEKSRSILSVNDFDGSGTIDVLGFNQQGVYTSANREDAPYLSRIIDSRGNSLTFTFKPLSDPAVYKRGSDATFPEVDYQSAYRVLAQVEMSNQTRALDDPIKAISYEYAGFKLHSTEFGGLGFASRTVRDALTGMSTVTRYSQDWQKHQQGSILAKATYDAKGKKQSDISYTYATKDLGKKRYATELQKSQAQQFGEDGQEIQNVLTEYRYDAHQNVIETAVTTKDAYGTSLKVSKQKFLGDESRWLIAKLTEMVIEESEQGKESRTTKKALRYDDNGSIHSLHQNVGTEGERVETFRYNQLGLPLESTVAWGSDAERASHQGATTTFEYDGNGRLAKVTGPKGHVAETVVSPMLGTNLSTKDPNGGVTSYRYDSLGALKGVTYPDGSKKTITHGLCRSASSSCPAGAYRYKTEQTEGAGEATAYYDSYSRIVKSRSSSFAGKFVNEDTEYTKFGLVSRRSLPYFDGDARYWLTMSYDDRLRLTKVAYPNGGSKSFAWLNYNVIETDGMGQTKEIRKDSRGRVREIIDSHGHAISHSHDASGNLLAISKDGSTQMSFVYDQLNRKVAQWSPNSGRTEFSYNNRGLLTETKFTDGRVESYSYDSMGRTTSRSFTSEKGQQTWQFTWDASKNGIGKLASVANKSGSYLKTYHYDSLSRVATVDLVSGGNSYSYSQQYDQFSNLKKYIYPSGLAVDYAYDDNGIMTAASRAGKPLWQLKGINVYGQVAKEQYGNGVTREITFDPKTNGVLGITAATAQSTPLQNYAYTYDINDRLTTAQNEVSGVAEAFSYDELDRLVNYSYGDKSTAITYGDSGNILAKSGVGQYRYIKNKDCPAADNTIPHAVSSIVGAKAASFCYDATGRMVSANKRTLTYGANGKVATIADPKAEFAFTYGPEAELQQKVEKFGGTTITTSYVDGEDYEVVIIDGKEAIKHNIGDNISIIQNVESGDERIEYYLKDRLGSITEVADAEGKLSHSFIYDPWGVRRDAQTFAPQSGRNASDGTQIRGFTGHNHLESLGLIEMRARIYDPELGRFISADRYYDSQDLQGLNPYSYVNNSPLQFTDPSGFFLQKLIKGAVNAINDGINSVKDAIHNPAETYKKGMRTYLTLGNQRDLAKNYDKSGRWVKNNEKTIITVAVMAAANTFVPGAGTLYGQMLLGALSSYYNSNGDLKSTAVGAISAGMFYGIGSAYAANSNQLLVSEAASKAVAHGIVGGFRSVAMGGNFEEGFTSAAISQVTALSGLYDALPQDMGSQLVAAAVIGGATAELTGGDFEDAALIAVISHSANDLSHAIKVISIGAGPALLEPTLVGEVVLVGGAIGALVWGQEMLESGLLDDLGFGDGYLFNEAKVPGIPTAADGFVPAKGWDGKSTVRVPNGKARGYPAKDKGVWVPTGPRGSRAHGEPHWDVQYPNGKYKNVLPGGRERKTNSHNGMK